MLVAGVNTSRLLEGDTTRAWDVATGKELPPFKGPITSYWSLVFAPDGRTLAGGSGGADGAIYLWEVATRKQRRVLRGNQGIIHGLAFSADGRSLASAGSDSTALVWDVWTAETGAHPAQRRE